MLAEILLAAMLAWGIGGLQTTVIVEDLPSPRVGQATVATAPRCTIWLDVSLFEPWAELIVTNVVIHEMGHCLWVPHSTDNSSIMYPVANFGAVLTDADREAFRTTRTWFPHHVTTVGLASD